MQRYYRTVNALSRLNEMLLQLFEEAILLADDSDEPQPINRRFQVRHGYLEVVRPNVFLRYPFYFCAIRLRCWKFFWFCNSTRRSRASVPPPSA